MEDIRLGHREHAHLAALFRLPRCALPRGEFFPRGARGGPRTPSVEMTARAALMRTALLTLPEWGPLFQLLYRASLAHYSLLDLGHGRLNPDFWQSPPLVSTLRNAAEGF
eukprot:4466823-Pyramimonas_sp.AAC.1